MSTTTPPTAPTHQATPQATPQAPPFEAALLALADRAVHDAEEAVVAVAVAKTHADALRDPGLSDAIALNVADVMAAAQTTVAERDAAHEAAARRDPANVRIHAELARAAADRAVAGQDAAVIRVQMESFAISSLTRASDPATGLTLGDSSPIRHRSRPY